MKRISKVKFIIEGDLISPNPPPTWLIKCEAEVHTSPDGKTWSCNWIGAGLFGGIPKDLIEDKSEMEAIRDNSLDDLSFILQDFGFSVKEITDAFNQIEIVDN
jgi:hypothetical protein